MGKREKKGNKWSNIDQEKMEAHIQILYNKNNENREEEIEGEEKGEEEGEEEEGEGKKEEMIMSSTFIHNQSASNLNSPLTSK